VKPKQYNHPKFKQRFAMIDPVIFTIRIGGWEFPLRWYGVIVMIGVIVGSLIVERELKRRGEKGDRIWDALIWVLPAGIIGARLWYILNATLGGNRYYIENPAQILNIPQGGLHIFGGLLLGGLALLYYLRQNKLDPWIFLDAAGPAMLIGQAIGRIANFINQELYGPPTTLPWGIPIAAEHRLPQFANLPISTRFHPTFAYEMVWNILAASFLLWLSRRYQRQLKPGALFAGWLIAAGVGRVIIEFFRPDQPKIPGFGFSYSSLVSALMAIAGVIMLLVRYKKINPAFAENWEEEYQIAKPIAEVEGSVGSETPQVKRTENRGESTLKKKAKAKIAERKAKEASSTRTTRAKKSS
jgi:phosphatidylglycerol:prolipoprotein diacylglycerol transferase